MTAKKEEHWSSEAYQNSASFVPKLATKVLGWLDVQPDDVILDIGCGDGILNVQIAHTLATGNGRIHGIDASEAMIVAAKKTADTEPGIEGRCTFEVLDATTLVQATSPTLQPGTYNKIFSNAAMHWILRPVSKRAQFFHGIKSTLQPNGLFVFEMGGMGNVAEMRTALLAVIGRRLGIQKARDLDPWFFPDEIWMKKMLEEEVGGFQIVQIEREYRPTRATDGEAGGIAGWVRLMGKQFFDGLATISEREEAEKEVCDILESVCASSSPNGGDWIGYVRLRAVVRKI